MSKLKFTKGELKRQRDSLAQFRHFLPTLQLKKQQLQMKIFEIRKLLEEKTAALESGMTGIQQWVGLLNDPVLVGLEKPEGAKKRKGIDWLKDWVIPEKIMTETVNVAGADTLVLKGVEFKDAQYDFFLTPLWIDKALEEFRAALSLLAEVRLIKKQLAILEQELRVTTQRVNLFEKIKIPECVENIRKIRIYLGDLQSNAVGISKVAKKKLEVKSQLSEIAFQYT